MTDTDRQDDDVRVARATIERLTTDAGRFVVACKDTGTIPAPVTGARFETAADAERARAAAERYRDAFRSVDPDLPRYDLVVSEADDGSVEFASVRERTGGRRANGLPRSRRTVTVAGDGDDEWLEVENAPVVHFQGPDAPLDDEVIARQLSASLDR
jgi:hypothetical protein